MLTLKAPAKINWFLKVLGLRNDGFHEIQSFIQKVTLHDVLTFTPLKDLIVRTDAPIPVEQNLVYKAAVLLKDRYRVKTGALIHLDKSIPVGAGLGGGSSDAATTLHGLNELWSLGLPARELCKMAEQLGSDVPFFLQGSLSFVRGRGEKITLCRATRPLSILLVKPPFSVSTEWVYKNLSIETFVSQKDTTVNLAKAGRGGFPEQVDRASRGFRTDPELTKKGDKVNNILHFIRNIEKANISNIAGAISNDLESVTIKGFPVIAEIKDRLSEQGAVLSLMSGSGPTVFGVFDSVEKAEEASRVFNDFWTAVVRTMIEEN